MNTTTPTPILPPLPLTAAALEPTIVELAAELDPGCPTCGHLDVFTLCPCETDTATVEAALFASWQAEERAL